MLAAEERTQLLKFVDQSPPGTPYLRRVRIILLDDEGASQETIATELQVPITRVRQMLRAYKREGRALFPQMVWSAAPYEAEDPVTDVARHIIADLVITLEAYGDALGEETTVTAVHESRKLTRKMRTALRLFDPYFQSHLLQSLRKRARKFMRRLSRSRDIAVFLLKLDSYLLESYDADQLTEQQRQALVALANYWREQQTLADDRVRRYVSQDKHLQMLEDFKAFGRGDLGQVLEGDEFTVTKAGYIAPIMIYEKLGHVRTMSDRLDDLLPERLHKLRIACKELRYTLEFFETMLGPSGRECIESVKIVLTHLGDVNDARVHMRMLDQMDDQELVAAVDLYRDVVSERLLQLREGFPSVWAEVDSPAWRERLAAAVAVL
jgi:CHAD domain-containing protein